MFKAVRGALPVILLCVCIAPALAQTTSADESSPKEQKKSFFERFSLFPQKNKQKTHAAAPAASDKEPPAEKSVVAPVADSLSVAATLLQQKERQVFLRRQAVCDRLRTIALDTGDEKLQRMAEDLLELAWQTYQMRREQLANVATGQSTDEQALRAELQTQSNQPTQTDQAITQRGLGFNNALPGRKDQ